MIAVIFIFIVGAVILLCITLKTKRRAIISVLISVAVVVLSFFLGILLPIHDTILFSLLAVFNISLIEFFIEWILSEQGQYLIEKTGYVPFR